MLRPCRPDRSRPALTGDPALRQRRPGHALRSTHIRDSARIGFRSERLPAVLHHLCLDQTLARIPGLLAPGGRLLVVGLARANSQPDLAVDLISAAANPVMGLIKHPRPARQADGPAGGQPVMPVRDPATTLAEITAAARAHLPGATVRRRLFFRYTLRWDKPPVTAPTPGSGTRAAR